MILTIGTVYLLAGIVPALWTVGHPVYGTPEAIAGRYLGFLQGALRRHHGFEIWIAGRDAGCIHMTDVDLAQLRITAMPLRRRTDVQKGAA